LLGHIHIPDFSIYGGPEFIEEVHDRLAVQQRSFCAHSVSVLLLAGKSASCETTTVVCFAASLNAWVLRVGYSIA
jgi:hypothetical protein